MTSTIIVDAHAGWPIKVTTRTYPMGDKLYEQIVKPGEMQRFHISSDTSLSISEEPRPLEQPQPVTDKVDVTEGYDAEVVRAGVEGRNPVTMGVVEAQASMLETFERTLGVNVGGPVTDVYKGPVSGPRVVTGYIDPIHAEKIRKGIG